MLWQLFISFLKIGAFTFGGGYAMVPLIEREVIDKRGWVEREDFLDLLTIAQSAPGPIALNTAVFVGYRIKGLKGAFASVAGIVLPSFVIILLVAIFFADIRQNTTVYVKYVTIYEIRRFACKEHRGASQIFGCPPTRRRRFGNDKTVKRVP
jgi:chromate transport protein ChrA